MSHPNRRQLGMSLVECAVVVAIVATAIGAGLPGLQEVRARHRLDGVAAQVETDLMLARSEAVARNSTVRLSFGTSAAGSCYVLHAGAAGDCSCSPDSEPVCRGEARALRHAGFPATAPVQVASRSASIVFDPSLGTVTPTATIRVVSPHGSVHQIVNIMGRVRSCVPAPGRAGYATC